MLPRLLSVFTLSLSLVFASSLTAIAQIKDAVSTTEEIDILAIAGIVLDADPEVLLDGLEEPPADRELSQSAVRRSGECRGRRRICDSGR